MSQYGAPSSVSVEIDPNHIQYLIEENQTINSEYRNNNAYSVADVQGSTLYKEDECVVIDSSDHFEVVNDVICIPDGVSTSGEEYVYNSLPPETNVDILVGKLLTKKNFFCVWPRNKLRASKSPFLGANIVIRRIENGTLRIFLHNLLTSSPCFTEEDCRCNVCNRDIERGELFISFPDDLDRRRMWAMLLGFKYTNILNIRSAKKYKFKSPMICTDHFSEECLRKFNFNKAALEAFGKPIPTSRSPIKLAASRRAPWVCPICHFKVMNVPEMYHHMCTHIENCNEIDMTKYPQGFACPFCRRCQYGYKTISGLKRHLSSRPLQHDHLKRIYDMAQENFRTSVLEPINDWESWTERNVHIAYHGFELARSPRKVVNTESAQASTSADSTASTSADVSSGSSQMNTGRMQSQEHVQESSNSANRMLPVNLSQRWKNFQTKLKQEHSELLRELVRKTAEEKKRKKEWSLSSPCFSKRSRCGVSDGSPQTSGSHFEQYDDVPEDMMNYSTSEQVWESGFTLADALHQMPYEPTTSQVDLVPDFVTQPLMLSPAAVELSSEERQMKTAKRMNQRKAAATEARVRLFGPSVDTDIPEGYQLIQTDEGLRVVEQEYIDALQREDFVGDVVNINRCFRRTQ